jgi:hypothetical protein
MVIVIVVSQQQLLINQNVIIKADRGIIIKADYF